MERDELSRALPAALHAVSRDRHDRLHQRADGRVVCRFERAEPQLADELADGRILGQQRLAVHGRAAHVLRR